MINRELLHVYNESVRIAHTQWTDWSDEATVTIATDPTVPSAPTLVTTAADQAIDLVITAPTTNTDGTSIVDIRDYTIYYSTSSGIDITNPATYSGTFNTTSTQHTFPTSAQHWFVCTCNDRWSNTSAGSSEVNATPTVAGGVPVSVDDYTDNISQVITGDGIIGIEFQVPKTTWERFVSWKLYAEDDAGGGSLPGSPTWALIYTGSGPGFVYKNLNTAWLYEFKLVVLGEDGTVTSGTISDNSGAGYQPNGANNDNVVAIEIFAENITATNEIRAPHIKASTITGDKLALTSYLAINSSTFGTDGIQLEYNSGNPRAYVGDGANAYVNFDGTKLTWKAANTELDASGNLTATSVSLTGAFTATSGTIGGFTIGASALTAGTGATAVGIAPGTYPFYAGSATAASAPFRVSSAGAVACSNLTISGGSININSGVFSVSAAGALAATSVTITGGTLNINSGVFTVSALGAVTCSNLTIIGGSININSGVFTVSAAGAVVASSISCTNLTVGAGSSWGGNALGTAYIPNLSATKITTDTMSVARILIDGNVNFKPGAVYRSIIGVDYIYGSDSTRHIRFGTQSNIAIQAGTGNVVSVGDGTGLYLNDTHWPNYLIITDWESASGAAGTAKGTITFNAGGVTRKLRFYG